MHAFVGVGELALQKLNGIIADLLVDFTNVGASAPGGGDAGDNEDAGLRQELLAPHTSGPRDVPRVGL